MRSEARKAAAALLFTGSEAGTEARGAVVTHASCHRWLVGLGPATVTVQLLQYLGQEAVWLQDRGPSFSWGTPPVSTIAGRRTWAPIHLTDPSLPSLSCFTSVFPDCLPVDFELQHEA